MDLWGWVAQNFGPRDALMATMLGLFSYLVRNIVRTQQDTASMLNNHLNEIAKHMAASNEIQRALLGKVLDAALRKPESLDK